jgi:hypothetical protein
VQSFWWQERELNSSTGPVFLTEFGPRLGLMGQLDLEASESIRFEMPLQWSSGLVDYDGHLQNGTPFKTHSFYTDWRLAVRGLYHLNEFIEFGPQLEYHSWSRTLDASNFFSKPGSHGYIEHWAYPAIGALVRLSPMDALSLDLGLNYPIFVNETVDLQNIAEVSLESHLSPEQTLSPYGVIAWEFRSIKLDLKVQHQLFRESRVGTLKSNDSYALGTFQPRSESWLVQCGLTFQILTNKKGN